MANTTTDSDELQTPQEGQVEGFEEETAVDDNDDSTPESDDTSEEAGDSKESESTNESDDSEMSDDEIKEWAEKKGLPLDDPVAALKAYREAEKKMHEQGKEVGELRKQVGKTAEDSLDEYASEDEGKQQRLIAQLTVTDFYLNNPEARNYDEKMAEIVKEKPYLANDLDTLLVVAKAQTSEEERLQARKEGEKAALKKVAKSQRQAAPKASATNQADTQPDEDPFLAGFDKG